MDVSSNLNFQNVARPINVPPSSAPGQVVVHEQLLAAVEGLKWKDARVATAGNVNLAAPGAAVDGVAMAIGDTFLVTNQTVTTENGKYIWNGAAVPATRALDSNTGEELEGSIYSISEGTSGGSQFRQSTVNFVIEVGSPVFTSFGATVPPASEIVQGKVELATQAETDAGVDATRAITPATLANSPFAFKGFQQLIGDGSATSFTVTHNLGTQDVIIEVRRNSGAFDVIQVDRGAPTVNTAVITFAAGLAPSANQFKVLVLKVA